MHTHTHTHTQTGTHVCMRRCACTHTHTNRYTCMHAQVRVHTHTHTHTYTHTNRYTCMHTHTHTHTHTCTHKQVHMYAYTHTHTHTGTGTHHVSMFQKCWIPRKCHLNRLKGFFLCCLAAYTVRMPQRHRNVTCGHHGEVLLSGNFGDCWNKCCCFATQAYWPQLGYWLCTLSVTAAIRDEV